MYCYDTTGKYHQHDFLVYPSVTEVPKRFFSKMKDKLMSTIFGWRNPSEDAKGLEIKVLDMEHMLKQCLHFYLESYMKTLLDGKHAPISGFEIDIVVREIANIYLQHRKPSVKHHEPKHCDCGFIEEVSLMAYFA